MGVARPRPNPDEALRMILDSDDGKHFRCDICGCRYPESTRRLQSGLDVSTLCHYEPDGGEVERYEQRAEGSRLGARLTALEVQPSPRPAGYDYDNEAAAATAFTPNPVQLTPGGGAESVTLTGVFFDGTETFDYGDAGITATETKDSASQYTLSITAGGGVPPGDYTFTFNGDQVFRKAIRVRS